MAGKIASRLELLFLDIFIYVLSDARWFRLVFRGSYEVIKNPALLKKFIAVCLLFGIFGMLCGWFLSVLLIDPNIGGVLLIHQAAPPVPPAPRSQQDLLYSHQTAAAGAAV